MSKFLISTLIAIIFIGAISAQSAPSNCMTTLGGKKYNFSGFGNSTSWSFVVAGTNPTTYYWNVCAAASKCNSIKPTTPASCQFQSNTYRNTGDLASGSFVNYNAGSSGGGAIKYTTTGSPCKSGNTRTTTVQMTCTPGKANIVTGADENPVGSCLYEVQLSGKSACPTTTPTTSGTTTGGDDGSSHSQETSSSHSGEKPKKKGLSGGWIFIIILLCSITVYLVVGVIINAKVRHMHGTDMIPNKNFWVEFGALIKDGVFFIKSKITRSNSGYQQV
ncbi:hypothetical protein CYY_009880 [Polysphondylium violaceum]|uniref:Autophagy-related protein 27 n=1 Tax=Polysphondylium violaceum TaxID=133409 RepID=A0A8J4PL13_9MYCE|nr:hypothetical protein CYY_009880 [Polysphondylium violaceum]